MTSGDVLDYLNPANFSPKRGAIAMGIVTLASIGLAVGLAPDAVKNIQLEEMILISTIYTVGMTGAGAITGYINQKYLTPALDRLFSNEDTNGY